MAFIDNFDTDSRPAAPSPSAGPTLARLAQWLSEILDQPLVEADLHLPLIYVGIDSLMALEFKTRILKELGVDVPINLLFNLTSCVQLATLVQDALADHAVLEIQ
ncbi:acyl carrier protein [Gloeobacter morelensis]|uniref:Acyl carrier protein n=1 Tax=Gloeobacter morelensis MG652769 TaxID=2781736 RepID=A0ABY3PHE0_9CYAN|nr:acyl carrier protein [Gloeobacter morelensis]UFP92958.1 acyl carrier protein [Gloeobacter morelensis MG652769]